MPRIAEAQAYPSRAVRIVVGYVAGGGNDLLARLIGQWLSERLGLKARLADLGAASLPGSSLDFGKFIAAETEKLGRVIRAANIKAE